MKFLLIVAALLLSGCAINPEDYATPEEYQAAVDARMARLERAKQYAEVMRLVAVNQIEIWNAAGIDPIQWDDSKLLKASALCGTATALMTVASPDMAALSATATQWCGTITKALAAAPEVAPLTAPEPEPRPAPGS